MANIQIFVYVGAHRQRDPKLRLNINGEVIKTSSGIDVQYLPYWQVLHQSQLVCCLKLNYLHKFLQDQNEQEN